MLRKLGVRLLVFCLCLLGNSAIAGQCPEDAFVNNAQWGVDSEAVYSFTSKVVEAVKDRDLKTIVSLIDGELQYGPRKRYMAGKTFSDVFTEDFRDAILNSGPTCYVHSWRGIMLGTGEIWIECDSSENFSIKSITSWIKEPVSTPGLPVGWIVDGKVLTPDCFVYEWASSDNYEEFSEHYGIQYDELYKNPGRYLSQIQLDPFIPSWCSSGLCEKLSLIHQAKPSLAFSQPKIKGTMVSYTVNSVEYSYEILAELPCSLGRTLAPSYDAECLKIYLVDIGEYSGGTMGRNSAYVVYGLFKDGSGEKVVAPLLNFRNKNEALNLVEDLKGT